MSEHTWSYRLGSWFGIFGTASALFLPGSEKHRAPELWSLIDDGAGPAPVLDVLVSSGLSDLPGFVLVGHGEQSTTILLRGKGVRVVALDGRATVEIDAGAARTWVEHTFTDLAAFTIHLEDDPGTDDLPIDTGLVRLARADHPAHVVQQASPLDTSSPQDPPVEAPPLEASPLESEADTNAVATPPASVVAALPPLDDDTSDGIDASEFTHAQPGIPGQEPAPAVTTSVARLVISNGETVDVDRVVLVGRAPEAPRFTSSDEPLLVSVPSPLHEISATHVEIRPGSGADHGSAVVTDMGSTNGTVVVQPGLGPEGLRPGIPVQLIPGATINLGDGITISVTQP